MDRASAPRPPLRAWRRAAAALRYALQSRGAFGIGIRAYASITIAVRCRDPFVAFIPVGVRYRGFVIGLRRAPVRPASAAGRAAGSRTRPPDSRCALPRNMEPPGGVPARFLVVRCAARLDPPPDPESNARRRRTRPSGGCGRFEGYPDPVVGGMRGRGVKVNREACLSSTQRQLRGRALLSTTWLIICRITGFVFSALITILGNSEGKPRKTSSANVWPSLRT